MTSDTDLRALFESWLADRAQVHKLAQAFGAMLRAHGDALTAAAVRTAYPPQVAAPAITHTAGSPMRSLGGSMHERTETRLARAPSLGEVAFSIADAKLATLKAAAAAEIAGHYRPGPFAHSEAEKDAAAEAMFSGGDKP